MIEASFAQQYNIRLEREYDMSWSEFFNFISGLLPESPLGQIVSIRAENDPERLKGFNKDQKMIRNEWRSKVNKNLVKGMTEKEKQDMTKQMQDMFKSMFSN